MLKRLKNNTGITIVILLIIILLIGTATMYRSEQTMMDKGTVIDTATNLPAPEKLSHLDSLPYFQYKIITDSLQKLAKIEKEKNTIHPWGYIAGISIMNVTGMGFLPTFRTWYGWYGDNKSHFEKEYYFSISGFHLTPEANSYFKDGKYYLQRESRSPEEISIGYLPEHKTILIPISSRSYSIGMVCMLILLCIVYFAASYIFLGLSINVLLNISRGKVFTETNIRDLYLIAYVSLGGFFIEIIFPYFGSIFAMSIIPQGFSISFSYLLSNAWLDGLIGLVVLAIAKAFSKGYQLQLEQDLTV